MAIGLCISLPRVGSAMNSFISPIVAEKTENGIANSFLVGTGFLIFSYGCGLILIYMDKESDRREKK